MIDEKAVVNREAVARADGLGRAAGLIAGRRGVAERDCPQFHDGAGFGIQDRGVCQAAIAAVKSELRNPRVCQRDYLERFFLLQFDAEGLAKGDALFVLDFAPADDLEARVAEALRPVIAYHAVEGDSLNDVQGRLEIHERQAGVVIVVVDSHRDLGGIVGAPPVVFRVNSDGGIGVGKAIDAVRGVALIDVVVDMVSALCPGVVYIQVAQAGLGVVAEVESGEVAIDLVALKVGLAGGSSHHHTGAGVGIAGDEVVGDNVVVHVSGSIEQIDAGEVVFDDVVVDIGVDRACSHGVPCGYSLLVVVVDVVAVDYGVVLS